MKFSLGLLFAGLGFALMIPAANLVVGSGGALKVSPWWLVFSYLLTDGRGVMSQPCWPIDDDEAVTT